VLDGNQNVLATLATTGGNSYQTFQLPVNKSGSVFFVDEFDTSTTWRYRDRIVVNAHDPQAVIGNTLQGNLIGTDVTGTSALGNAGSGVVIQNAAARNLVGGTTAGARNLISGNSQSGVQLASNAASNVVQGNFIGTNATGTAAVPNSQYGVYLNTASVNSIL